MYLCFYVLPTQCSSSTGINHMNSCLNIMPDVRLLCMYVKIQNVTCCIFTIFLTTCIANVNAYLNKYRQHGQLFETKHQIKINSKLS